MNHASLSSARPLASAHPLGPIAFRAAARNPTSARWIAGAVAAGCATLLAVAASLTPDPAGVGTHQQLGFPPCTSIMLTGYPCPTCGMTTAFAHTVRGQWLAAFQAQPAGFALALAVLVAGAMAISVLYSGRVWVFNGYRLPPIRMTLFVVAIVFGGWGYKLAIGLLTGALPIGR